jgi:hypothetical protein
MPSLHQIDVDIIRVVEERKVVYQRELQVYLEDSIHIEMYIIGLRF